MARPDMRRLSGLLLWFGASAWAWGWEFVRSLVYEQGSHMLTPLFNSVSFDSMLHWIPPLIFAAIGLWLFWKTRPIGKEFDEIQSFFNSWINPVAQNINQVLQRIMNAIQKHADPAVKSHGSLIQRSIIDEERAALSNLSNAFSGIEQTSADDLQHRVGRYYKSYQGCRTWIVQGIGLAGIINLRDDPIFQEWLRLDEEFLRELRRFTGPVRYDVLRAELDSTGWGEIVTRDLRGL
jgi:hypothetical protein